MEHLNAFIDETGNFGWDFSKEGTSKLFVLTAILVKDGELAELQENIEAVRKEEFQQGEMKSSKINDNDHRRMRIIQKLLKFNFTYYAIVFDKQRLTHMEGLRYHKSFYKFFNNIIHKELQKNFPHLTIFADETGTTEYMASFIKYVREHQIPKDLFGSCEFCFENSKNTILIQLADIFSGTISRIYSSSKRHRILNTIFQEIQSRGCIETYPQDYKNFDFDKSTIAQSYDRTIAEICYRRACEFVITNESSCDDDTKAQVFTVKYLLFRFINNDLRHYIYTRELRAYLENMLGTDITERFFRTKVIAKLRDKGVVISSGPHGYKIPTQQSDLYDFVSIASKTIIPMLERIKKCSEIIKSGTLGEVDLLANEDNNILRKCIQILTESVPMRYNGTDGK